MTAKLAIIGVGGQGRECLDIAEAMAGNGVDLQVVGFYDDSPSEMNVERVRKRGYDVLGGFDDLLQSPSLQIVLGIGASRVRADLDAHLTGRGLHSPVLVHPSATISDDVRLDPGTVVFAGARLTTNIRVGRHTHLNQNTTVGHDTRLGSYVTVNPAAAVSGDCSVDDGATLGAGSVVLQGRRVGRDSTVGACACVVRDVPAGYTVVGVPAQRLEGRGRS